MTEGHSPEAHSESYQPAAPESPLILGQEVPFAYPSPQWYPPYSVPPYSVPPYSVPPYSVPPYSAPLMTTGYPYYPVPVAPTTNGFAIASLILSIAGIVMLGIIGSILGITFGYIAQSQIRQARVPENGAGLATAGIIIGYIGIVWNILLIGLWLFFVFILPLTFVNYMS